MSSIGSGGANSWQASFSKAAGQGDETLVWELLHEGAIHGDKYRDALRIVSSFSHLQLPLFRLCRGFEEDSRASELFSGLYWTFRPVTLPQTGPREDMLTPNS